MELKFTTTIKSYVFRGSALKDCNGFNLPDDEIPNMKLHYDNHPGYSDNVAIDWIRVILDNYSYVLCPDGKLMGVGIHQLDCVNNKTVVSN